LKLPPGSTTTGLRPPCLRRPIIVLKCPARSTLALRRTKRASPAASSMATPPPRQNTSPAVRSASPRFRLIRLRGHHPVARRRRRRLRRQHPGREPRRALHAPLEFRFARKLRDFSRSFAEVVRIYMTRPEELGRAGLHPPVSSSSARRKRAEPSARLPTLRTFVTGWPPNRGSKP
jgi:hypothetical protein